MIAILLILYSLSQTMCDEVAVELDWAIQEELITYREAESIAGRCAAVEKE